MHASCQYIISNRITHKKSSLVFSDLLFDRIDNKNLDIPLGRCHSKHRTSINFLRGLEDTTLGGRQDDQLFVHVLLLEGFGNLDGVLVRDVLVGAQGLVVQELLLYFTVELVDHVIQLSLLLAQLVKPLHVLLDFSLVVVLVGLAHPPDRVLLHFLHVANSLQYIGNIVYASFLHLQQSHR